MSQMSYLQSNETFSKLQNGYIGVVWLHAMEVIGMWQITSANKLSID